MPLWPDAGIPATLTRHVRDDSLIRPAILVIPGGGYAGVCWDYEGIPIADLFDELGYQTFFLDYRTAPNNPWPATLDDAVRAVRLIRGHGAEWGVQPNAIAVCGFSAGGHLAAALGTIAAATTAVAGDRFDTVSPVPDAMLLCYPVILSGEFAHKPSGKNFFCVDETTPKQDALFSLDRPLQRSRAAAQKAHCRWRHRQNSRHPGHEHHAVTRVGLPVAGRPQGQFRHLARPSCSRLGS